MVETHYAMDNYKQDKLTRGKRQIRAQTPDAAMDARSPRALPRAIFTLALGGPAWLWVGMSVTMHSAWQSAATHMGDGPAGGSNSAAGRFARPLDRIHGTEHRAR